MKWLLVPFAVCLFGGYSCNPKCDTVTLCYYYIDGDSTHKIQISYYNGGTVTESVQLPCYFAGEAESCNTDKFFLTICDTSVTHARAVIFYGGLNTGKVGNTTCSVDPIIMHLFNPTLSQGVSDQCYITSDSLFSYLKNVNYPGTMEISKNNNCQTIKPVSNW